MREFHWFESGDEMRLEAISSALDKKSITYADDYLQTEMLINDKKYNIIYSTQSHFFHQSLIDKGFKLFVHYYKIPTFEVKRGNCIATERYINPGYNLEKMLFNGEFKSYIKQFKIDNDIEGKVNEYD